MTEDELNKILTDLIDETTNYPGDDTSDRECVNTMAYMSGVMDMYRKVKAHIVGEKPSTLATIANVLSKVPE